MIKEPVFKAYRQNQPYLIPPTWDEKIKAEHPVRVVNKIIDSINLKDLYMSYKGGGTSSNDPDDVAKTNNICIYK